MLGRKSAVNMRIILYIYIYTYTYIYIYVCVCVCVCVYTLCGQNTEFLLGARYEAKKKKSFMWRQRPSLRRGRVSKTKVFVRFA